MNYLILLSQREIHVAEYYMSLLTGTFRVAYGGKFVFIR